MTPPATPEYLALRARYSVALMVSELAGLRVREYEVRHELMQFVERTEGAAAAASLARSLESIAQGER